MNYWEVPYEPNGGVSQWLESNFEEPNMPYFSIKMRLRTIYWTLDPILHNFFEHINIRYSLDCRNLSNVNEISRSDDIWVVDFLTKDDLLMFKLYWTSAEDVYDNFKVV
jgi:hypothetical protein